jgi:hypothetical protein
MGWEELEEKASVPGPADEAFSRKARAFHQFFTCPLGQEILEFIQEHTESKTTLPNQAADGSAMALLMAVREGENNLYRWIKHMIKKGQPKV